VPENTNENDGAASSDGEGQSSEEAAGAEQNQPSELELAKRRQAGADKARDAAIAERDALQARLDAALSAKPPKKDDDGAGTVDIEAVKRELRAEFEAELANKTKAQEAKFLDAQFPEARKRFPEVTDPVKLTELETLFGEAPKPVGNNAAKGSGQKNIEDMTSKELQAYMKGLDPSTLGLRS